MAVGCILSSSPLHTGTFTVKQRQSVIFFIYFFIDRYLKRTGSYAHLSKTGPHNVYK